MLDRVGLEDRRGLFGEKLNLRLIRHAHGNPIQREIARGVGGHVDDAHTEVGVGEVAGAPRAAPVIGHAAKSVGGFTGGERAGLFGRHPTHAAIP